VASKQHNHQVGSRRPHLLPPPPLPLPLLQEKTKRQKIPGIKCRKGGGGGRPNRRTPGCFEIGLLWFSLRNLHQLSYCKKTIVRF
jgi:hypothetical protein